MLVGDHITSSLRRICASQQALERLQTSLERTSDAVRKSREAVRKSKALLSLHEPRPQPLAQLSLYEPRPRPLVSPEKEMERWQIAIALVQKLNAAGYGCQLSRQAEQAC
jgi:hypothetical protein